MWFITSTFNLILCSEKKKTGLVLNYGFFVVAGWTFQGIHFPKDHFIRLVWSSNSRKKSVNEREYDFVPIVCGVPRCDQDSTDFIHKQES